MQLLFLIAVCLGISACSKFEGNAQEKSQPASTVASSSKKIDSLLNEAQSELEKKNYGKTIEIAIEITSSDPNNYKAYYFESQAQSSTGEQQKAIKTLEDAFKSGLKPTEDVVNNKNFDSIRESVEFKSLTKKFGTNQSGSALISDKEISAGNTSIKEEGGKQEIRAGDIVIKVPAD